MKVKNFNIILFIISISFFVFSSFFIYNHKRLLKIREDEVYLLINTIYKDQELDAVVDENIHFSKKGNSEINFYDFQLFKDQINPDFSSVIYNKNDFYILYNEGYLNKIDIEYMFKRIEKNEVKVLFKEKVNFKLFNLNEHIDKNIEKFYDDLNETYGTYSFVRFYDPVFSSDGKTVIIDMTIQCGGLCGGGNALIYKKIDNKWKKVIEFERWVS